jgi:hypothetical protein
LRLGIPQTLSPRFVEEAAAYARRVHMSSSLPSDRWLYELCFVFDYASFPEQLFSREVTAKEDGQSSARTNDKNQQVQL